MQANSLHLKILIFSRNLATDQQILSQDGNRRYFEETHSESREDQRVNGKNQIQGETHSTLQSCTSSALAANPNPHPLSLISPTCSSQDRLAVTFASTLNPNHRVSHHFPFQSKLRIHLSILLQLQLITLHLTPSQFPPARRETRERTRRTTSIHL